MTIYQSSDSEVIGGLWILWRLYTDLYTPATEDCQDPSNLGYTHRISRAENVGISEDLDFDRHNRSPVKSREPLPNGRSPVWPCRGMRKGYFEPATREAK